MEDRKEMCVFMRWVSIWAILLGAIGMNRAQPDRSSRGMTWFRGMTEAYGDHDPMIFRYVQLLADDTSIRHQKNASCIMAIFYFLPKKIIYHFAGVMVDPRRTVINHDGMLIPDMEEYERTGRDCYLMFKNGDSRILSLCVLRWEMDQSILIMSSGKNTSVAALSNHVQNREIVRSALNGLTVTSDMTFYPTIQQRCPIDNPIQSPPLE